MEYEVQLAPIDKTVLTPEGFLEPLCNSCSAIDCTNPIKEMSVSVAGVVKKNRYYVASESMIRQVVNCKGYQGNVVPPLAN